MNEKIAPVVIQIRVEARLYERVMVMAKQLGISRAAAFNIAISEWLASQSVRI